MTSSISILHTELSAGGADQEGTHEQVVRVRHRRGGGGGEGRGGREGEDGTQGVG